MHTATISTKNQITIPAKVIKSWGFDKNNRQVIWDIVKRKNDILLVIKPKPKSMVDEFAGIAEGVFDVFGGAEAFIKKERASWD